MAQIETETKREWEGKRRSGGPDDLQLNSATRSIYEGQSGKLITSILRPGRRPTGKEIVSILKRVVGAIRREWPEVLILLRGDSHCSTPEVHQWCESQDPVIFYILGQSGNAVLTRAALELVEQARSLYRYKRERAWRKQAQRNREQERAKGKQGRHKSERQEPQRPQEITKAKLYTTFLYKAESWLEPHRIICKVEVSDEGENIRFVVTNLVTNRNQWIYETIYCGRGQMENYIKDHKLFLHADRTSCHKFEANQFRLFLHSAAYVLMHTLRAKGLRGTAWCKAQFNQMQLRLLKVGARVDELKTKVTFHFPTAFPLKEVYETVLSNLSRSEPCRSP